MIPGFYAGVGLIDLNLSEKKNVFSPPVRIRSGGDISYRLRDFFILPGHDSPLHHDAVNAAGPVDDVFLLSRWIIPAGAGKNGGETGRLLGTQIPGGFAEVMPGRSFGAEDAFPPFHHIEEISRILFFERDLSIFLPLAFP